MVKEFWKSVHICQSYHIITHQVASFFGIQCMSFAYKFYVRKHCLLTYLFTYLHTKKLSKKPIKPIITQAGADSLMGHVLTTVEAATLVVLTSCDFQSSRISRDDFSLCWKRNQKHFQWFLSTSWTEEKELPRRHRQQCFVRIYCYQRHVRMFLSAQLTWNSSWAMCKCVVTSLSEG